MARQAGVLCMKMLKSVMNRKSREQLTKLWPKSKLKIQAFQMQISWSRYPTRSSKQRRHAEVECEPRRTHFLIIWLVISSTVFRVLVKQVHRDLWFQSNNHLYHDQHLSTYIPAHLFSKLLVLGSRNTQFHINPYFLFNP